MSDVTQPAAGGPWIPEEVLHDLVWTNRHTANGWRSFFEERGVDVRPATPSS